MLNGKLTGNPGMGILNGSDEQSSEGQAKIIWGLNNWTSATKAF